MNTRKTAILLLSLLLSGCVSDNQVRIAQAQAVIEQAKAAQDAAQAAQIAATGLAGATVGQTLLIGLLVVALLVALAAIWLLLRQNNTESLASTAAQLTGQQGAWLPGPNANWQRRMKPADMQTMLLLQILQQQMAQHPQQPIQPATLPAPTETTSQDLWSQL